MRKNTIRYLLYFIAFVVVFYPLWVWYQGVDLVTNKFVLFDVFPTFGLIAFSVMWLHIVGGALKEHLEKFVNYEHFVFLTSIVVFASLLLHPGLLFMAFFLNGGGSYFDYTPKGKEYLIIIAILAWIIFVVYDFLKILHKRGHLKKYWGTIKLISTLAFFLVLVHSLGIGRDLQTGPLKIVWIVYGITAAMATHKTYFAKQ